MTNEYPVPPYALEVYLRAHVLRQQVSGLVARFYQLRYRLRHQHVARRLVHAVHIGIVDVGIPGHTAPTLPSVSNWM